MEEICTKAISGVGGPAKLATALSERGIKITSQAISQWKRVPPDRVIAIEEITGISRHDIRPDIFGRSPERLDAIFEAQGLRVTDDPSPAPEAAE